MTTITIRQVEGPYDLFARYGFTDLMTMYARHAIERAQKDRTSSPGWKRRHTLHMRRDAQFVMDMAAIQLRYEDAIAR